MNDIRLSTQMTPTPEFEVLLTIADKYILLLYRLATFVTVNVIDDAAMLAFGLS